MERFATEDTLDKGSIHVDESIMNFSKAFEDMRQLEQRELAWREEDMGRDRLTESAKEGMP